MITPNRNKTKLFLHSIYAVLLTFSMPVLGKASDIVTTLPPIAGLVQWLEPDADITCLLPANADPHHFQLPPHQVESLRASKLLVRSSQDDGHWTKLKHQGYTIDLWPHAQQHIANHAWLNPQEVRHILPELAQQLIKLYPQDAQSIQRQLELALTQSEQMWQAWQDMSHSSGLTSRGVIMQHPSWRNLFEALHIPVWNTLESEQHGHEHGPHKLEGALQQLQQHPGIRLIADSRHSNRALQWLQAHHPSSAIITLDALGTCGESWMHLMQRNLNTIEP